MKKYDKYKEYPYDWLPVIPAHWEEKSLRNYFLLSDERKGENTDLELLSVYREYGVIPKASRDDNKNVESEDTSKYKVVHKTDLVINKMKLWQGSLGISQYEGFVSPAYIVAHNKFKGNLRYLNLFLRSPHTIIEFLMALELGNGIRIFTALNSLLFQFLPKMSKIRLSVTLIGRFPKSII